MPIKAQMPIKFLKEIAGFHSPKIRAQKAPAKATTIIQVILWLICTPLVINPAIPEIEFTKINKADTAAVCFKLPQCNNNITGLKIIPPPMPIIPDITPIAAPIINDHTRFCFLNFSILLNFKPINLITENRSNIPKIVLYNPASIFINPPKKQQEPKLQQRAKQLPAKMPTTVILNKGCK